MFDLEKFKAEKVNKVTWNNCLVWAFWHWFRYGGYLVVRRAGKNRNLWWPHFMWKPVEHSELYHFTPCNRVSFPWPIFKGYVMEGDWVPDETP